MTTPFICKSCGERIQMARDEYQAFLDGEYLMPPEFCDECEESTNQIHEPDTFSDADQGL